MTVFALFIDSELPEVQAIDDLEHIRRRCIVGASDDTAAKHLDDAIQKSVRNWTTQLNNWVHNIVR